MLRHVWTCAATARPDTQHSAGARAKEAASLHLAVQLGHRVLTKGDALFLERLLIGEVPKAHLGLEGAPTPPPDSARQRPPPAP